MFISVTFDYIHLRHSGAFCTSFFLFPSCEAIWEPSISLDFSWQVGDTQTILKLIGESLFRKFYLSYSEKWPSEYTAICPSEHNPQKVSFRTWYHVSFKTWIGSYMELKHNLDDMAKKSHLQNEIFFCNLDFSYFTCQKQSLSSSSVNLLTVFFQPFNC